jgi:hypothetical protein
LKSRLFDGNILPTVISCREGFFVLLRRQRLPPQREGDMSEADTEKRKKFAVQLSTGARDVGKVK